jgi:hypothetical protein
MGDQGEPDINSLEVHPQLSLISHNQHPVDGVLMGDGSIWMKITSPVRTTPNFDCLKF